MELRQLRYFLAVLEEGNLSRAAKKLNMSQPPLSTQMKLLEGELGCELFLRGARRVTPTGAGRLLYERAKAITALCDETEQAVRETMRNAGATSSRRCGSTARGSPEHCGSGWCRR